MSPVMLRFSDGASHTRGASHRLSRPAFENLQRTKPRGMMRGRAATAYGDLKALAGETGVRRAASWAVCEGGDAYDEYEGGWSGRCLAEIWGMEASTRQAGVLLV